MRIEIITEISVLIPPGSIFFQPSLRERLNREGGGLFFLLPKRGVIREVGRRRGGGGLYTKI